MKLARRAAEEIAACVDELLAQPGQGRVVRLAEEIQAGAAPVVACSCQSGGVPAKVVLVAGVPVAIVGLEPIMKQVAALGDGADMDLRDKLMQMVKVYNAIPVEQEAQYAEALWREFASYRTKNDAS